MSDFFWYRLLSWQVSLPVMPCSLPGTLGLHVSPLYSARKNLLLNHQRKSWFSIWLGRPWWNLYSSVETWCPAFCPIWREIDSPPRPSLWRPKSVSFLQWIILFQLFLVAPNLTSLLLFWNAWRYILRFLEVFFCFVYVAFHAEFHLCLYGSGFLYLY